MFIAKPQLQSVAANQQSPEQGADLQRYFRDMLLIRRFEEKAGQLYGMGLIGGFCHLYIGQEAVVVGIQAAKKRLIVLSHRTVTMVICWLPVWRRVVLWLS